jgi:hypothetical protein
MSETENDRPHVSLRAVSAVGGCSSCDRQLYNEVIEISANLTTMRLCPLCVSYMVMDVRRELDDGAYGTPKDVVRRG